MINARPAIILYMPVIQQAYLDFIAESDKDAKVYILSDMVTEAVASVKKDKRALPSKIIVGVLRSTQQLLFPGADRTFIHANATDLARLGYHTQQITMTDEDISHHLADIYFCDVPVERPIVFVPVHLRWNQRNIYDSGLVSNDTPPVVIAHLATALQLSEKSPDWWRQVGAVCFRGESVVGSAYNLHLPSNYEVLFVGDPRSSSSKGKDIDLSLALHAEAGIIAEAARLGKSLDGASLVVTTFPCPVCARLIAASGIKAVYYLEPYSMLDAELVLTSANVALIPIIKKPLPA